MALGTPLGLILQWPGITRGDAGVGVGSALRTLDAAGEYDGYVIPAREDMTISHVGLFATCSGSPTIDVRIETVSTADGFPTGTLWGTNTNLVTGALTTGFTLHALTASASITRGQIFAVRFNFISGTSLITRSSGLQYGASTSMPYEVFSIGTPTRTATSSWHPYSLGSSATTFYQFENALPILLGSAPVFNNTNAAKRGVRFRIPFKCRCVGIRTLQAAAGGSFNILITDDAGNELGSSSTAIAGVQQSTVTGSLLALFDTPVALTPGTWYRSVIEPTTTTNVRLDQATLPSADYRMAWPGGMDFYHTEFASGTWTDSTDKISIMDLLVDQFGDGRDPPTYAMAL